jgi:hypothetical protein
MALSPYASQLDTKLQLPRSLARELFPFPCDSARVWLAWSLRVPNGQLCGSPDAQEHTDPANFRSCSSQKDGLRRYSGWAASRGADVAPRSCKPPANPRTQQADFDRQGRPKDQGEPDGLPCATVPSGLRAFSLDSALGRVVLFEDIESFIAVKPVGLSGEP